MFRSSDLYAQASSDTTKFRDIKCDTCRFTFLLNSSRLSEPDSVLLNTFSFVENARLSSPDILKLPSSLVKRDSSQLKEQPSSNDGPIISTSKSSHSTVKLTQEKEDSLPQKGLLTEKNKPDTTNLSFTNGSVSKNKNLKNQSDTSQLYAVSKAAFEKNDFNETKKTFQHDSLNFYSVQIGAFKNIVDKNYFNGLSFFAIDDLDKIKYYSGKFQSKDEANDYMIKVQEKGINDAFVVKLSSKTKVTPYDSVLTGKPKEINPNVKYSVQIGMFKTTVPTDLVIKYIKIKDVRLDKTEDGSIQVTVGTYKEKNEAEKIKRDLIDAGFNDAFIIEKPPLNSK